MTGTLLCDAQALPVSSFIGSRICFADFILYIVNRFCLFSLLYPKKLSDTSQADIRNPLCYLLIINNCFAVYQKEPALLLIQASPHPMLIVFRNPAGDLLDSVKIRIKPALRQLLGQAFRSAVNNPAGSRFGAKGSGLRIDYFVNSGVE